MRHDDKWEVSAWRSDGSIRINTNISTKDAKVQLSALRHTIVKTAGEIVSLRSRMDVLKNVEVPTKGFTDLEAELKKAASEYDKLRAKMDNPGKPTEEYRSLQKQLQKAQSELERLAEQQSEMEGMGLERHLCQRVTRRSWMMRRKRLMSSNRK